MARGALASALSSRMASAAVCNSWQSGHGSQAGAVLLNRIVTRFPSSDGQNSSCSVPGFCFSRTSVHRPQAPGPACSSKCPLAGNPIPRFTYSCSASSLSAGPRSFSCTLRSVSLAPLPSPIPIPFPHACSYPHPTFRHGLQSSQRTCLVHVSTSPASA